MTKHTYLPTTLNSDKGTAFMSHLIKEVAGVLGITLKRATTKHAQTIGPLAQSHASIKQALKIETGARKSFWDKYVKIADLNYNTSYHTSLAVSQAKRFTAVFPIIFRFQHSELPHSNSLFLLLKLPKIFLLKQK